jgi:hypothetical protein
MVQVHLNGWAPRAIWDEWELGGKIDTWVVLQSRKSCAKVDSGLGDRLGAAALQPLGRGAAPLLGHVLHKYSSARLLVLSHFPRPRRNHQVPRERAQSRHFPSYSRNDARDSFDQQQQRSTRRGEKILITLITLYSASLDGSESAELIFIKKG